MTGFSWPMMSPSCFPAEDNFMTTTKQPTELGCSHTQCQTLEALTTAFIDRELEATIKKKDGFGNSATEGTNHLNALNAIWVIAKAICANFTENSFSFDDCLIYARAFNNLEYPMLDRLFHSWVEFLRKQNPPRVQFIEGCYQNFVYRFI